jgi:hypothetical protein
VGERGGVFNSWLTPIFPSFQPDYTLLFPTPLTTVIFSITHVYPTPQQCYIEQVYRVHMSPLLAHGCAHVMLRTEIYLCEWYSHCELVYLLVMATCSYLCKQQRIRRQGSSGSSYYGSRSDIAMHCDCVAAHVKSTDSWCVHTERHNHGSVLRLVSQW